MTLLSSLNRSRNVSGGLAMEEKGLRINVGKTKIMICGTGLDLLQSSGEFPCAVCHTGVGSNSIFCNSCKHWVHKKCSGFKHLTKDPDYRCTRCQGTARRLDGRLQRGPTWQAGGGSFLLLPRRHALSSQWLWTFNHNMCENHLEEVQGAATNSFFPSAAKWQGNDQTDLQCQATRHSHQQIQGATCAAWHWGSGPHFEGE